MKEETIILLFLTTTLVIPFGKINNLLSYFLLITSISCTFNAALYNSKCSQRKSLLRASKAEESDNI